MGPFDHAMYPHGHMATIGEAPKYERAQEREGYTGGVKPPAFGGPGQPANQVYPCWCQTPMAMALGETAQVREYPEVAESRPFRLRENKHSGGV